MYVELGLSLFLRQSLFGIGTYISSCLPCFFYVATSFCFFPFANYLLEDDFQHATSEK